MEDSKTYGKISLRIFIVDFFGALVPGLMFFFLLILTLVFPTYLYIKTLVQSDNQKNFIEYLNLINKVDKFGLIEIGLFILIVSFVIGTFFYRLDPKKPDGKSCRKTIRKFKSSYDKDNWVEKEPHERVLNVIKKIYRKRFILVRPIFYLYYLIIRNKKLEKRYQYPYRYLKKYLKSRGLDILSDKIPWDGDDASYKKRSKTYINILKMRIAFHYPAKCGTIIKNEAHIRLTSTMWYIALELLKMSVLGIFFSLLILRNIDSQEEWILIPISINLFVIAFCFWIKNRAEKFLHYQRVREIIFVMETALITSRMEGCEYIYNLDKIENWTKNNS